MEEEWVPACAGTTEGGARVHGFPPVRERQTGWVFTSAAERHSHDTDMLVESTPRLGQKGSGERRIEMQCSCPHECSWYCFWSIMEFKVTD
jgi:hypothetical protein